MRGAIGISVAFHLTLVTAAWTGLPVLFVDTTQEESPIIVELVTIAEKTRAAPETVRPEAPEPEPAKPKPAKAEPKPPPPPPAAKPAPPAPPAPERVAALPPPPIPEPKPKVVEPPPPPPETRAAPEPPVPQLSQINVRPRAKPEPPAKTPKFDASRIAVLIDKTRKEEAPEAEPEPEESKRFLRPPPIPESPVRRAAIGNQITLSEVDAIRHQIEKCWLVPAGARDARDLVITVQFSLKPDGSLKRQPVVLGRDRMDDGFFRTAAESARRAVQRCTPLKNLPTSKYDRWQDITLTFNPREMLGG